MSMQINVDPAGLTQEQREAVAGFILAYPAKACGGTCHTSVAAEIHDNTEAVSLRVPNAGAAAVAANPVGAVLALNDEIAHLAKEGGESSEPSDRSIDAFVGKTRGSSRRRAFRHAKGAPAGCDRRHRFG